MTDMSADVFDLCGSQFTWVFKPLEGEFETLLIWLGEPKKKAVKIQSVQLRLCL